MAPVISVIIPVYNAECFLEQCLNSVLNQTLGDIEVICVNDGSSDRSGLILERYQERDSRVIVIHQENQGLSCARNCGLRQAAGEYIGFVDSDDFIAPEMFETLFHRAKAECADIVICDVYLYDHNTGQLSNYRDQALYEQLSGQCVSLNSCPALIRQIGAWDRIYRREFLARIGAAFPPGLIYEDAAFTAQTLSKAERVCVIAEKLYYYRKNVGTSITDREALNDRYKQSFLDIQPIMLETIRSNDLPQRVYAEYLHYFMPHAFAHQMYATTPQFFRHFFEGVRSLLTPDSYAQIRAEFPTKVKIYGFFLRCNYMELCRGFFGIWNFCRQRLKRFLPRRRA